MTPSEVGRRARQLSALPVKDGVYLAHENCPQTSPSATAPSVHAGPLGVLPGTKVDRETMRRTLKKVFAEWKWADTWGWDFPMVAMTAASLESATRHRRAHDGYTQEHLAPNGHNWQRANLPPTSGQRRAVAGGCAHGALGAFPDSWNARWEGLGD